MPLLVHCPNNCKIRVPASRVGRVIRCTECKSPIKIPEIDSPLLETGNWVECRAKRAIKKSEIGKEQSLRAQTNLSNGGESNQPVEGVPSESAASDAQISLDPPVNRAPLLRAKPWRTVEPLTTVDPEDTPVSIDLNQGQVSRGESKRKETFTATDEISEVPSISLGKNNAVVEKPPVIQLDSRPVDTPVETKSWSERLADANADRKVLTRFLAFCLFLIAIVNVIPAVNHFYSWWGMEESIPLPTWIYLQIFAGSIFLIYSIFLLQVQDWSALRGVSIAMLVVAFLFGAASTALLVADDGWIAGVLGIPYALSQAASMWCVIVVCLTTLISLWAGKESINWQRAERMLNEIMDSSRR